MYRLCLITLLSITIASCTANISHKQTINSEPMLIGVIAKSELFSEFPIFKTNYENYSPNDSVIGPLKNYSESIHIEIFLGTWCSDSKRNLPPFLKTLDRVGRPNITYTLHALDRTKKDADNLTVKYSIKRVPTMVFLKNEKEMGRITEYPVKSVEEDMLSILRQ